MGRNRLEGAPCGREEAGGGRVPLYRIGEAVRGACRRLGRSEKTAYLYVGWARRFVVYHQRAHPADLDVRDVWDFLSSGCGSGGSEGLRPGSGAARNQALHALRFLYRYVLGTPLAEKPLAGVRVKQDVRLPASIEADTVVQFCRQLSGVPRLVALLQLGCGLRVEEILALRLGDLRLDEARLVVRGTGSRALSVPAVLVEKLRLYIQEYRSGVGARAEEPLFVGNRRRRRDGGDGDGVGVLQASRLQAQTIRRAYKAVRPSITPHALRHYYAISMLDRGENIVVVHRNLGQRDIHTTLRYAAMSKHGTAASVRSPVDDPFEELDGIEVP